MRGNRIFENGLGGTPGGGVQGIGIDLGFATGPDGPTANDPGDGDAGSGYANDCQNFPLITSAAPEGGGHARHRHAQQHRRRPSSTSTSTANPACRARPRALLQGETYLGTTQVTTDAAGNASFNVLLSTPIEAGAPVTATATDAAGNTSEFWNPILFRDTPGVGGPGDNTPQRLLGQLFEPGATITVGGTPIAGVTETSTTRRDFVGPALTPGTVYDIVLSNPSGLSGTLHNGYVSRFADVAPYSLFDQSDRQARRQQRHGRLRRRQLLPELQRHSQTDGRLRAQGEARRLLRSSSLQRRLSGRAVQLELRAVDRGLRRRGNHRRLRQRQLLPRRERAARPDGRLSPEGKVRGELHSAALRRSLRRRRVPVDLRELDRRARGRRASPAAAATATTVRETTIRADKWPPSSSRP